VGREKIARANTSGLTPANLRGSGTPEKYYGTTCIHLICFTMPMKCQTGLIFAVLLLAGAAPEGPKDSAATQPAVDAPLVVHEHVDASAADLLDVDKKKHDSLPVIRLEVPAAIQQRLAEKLQLYSGTFQDPCKGMDTQIVCIGKKVSTWISGLTNASVDLHGPFFRVPLKWKYSITLKEIDNEPIEGGQHVSGNLELRSSRGDYSIHFDSRVLIGRGADFSEAKSAEVTWTGPNPLK